MIKVDSKTVYEWFYFADMPKHIPFYTGCSEFELSDDTLNITLSDMKAVLKQIRDGRYQFKKVFDWVDFFMCFIGKLTYEQRHPKIEYEHNIWEVGYEGDELDFILSSLSIQLNCLYDEELEDIELAYSYIDDLLMDIEYFENEEWLGSHIRKNFSMIRTGCILVYFAFLKGATHSFNNDEITLYQKMRDMLIDFQDGLYENGNILIRAYIENLLVRIKDEEDPTDRRIRYIIDYTGGIRI